MNMSYCRFNNTRIDMDDCLEALEEIYGIIEYGEEPEHSDWKLSVSEGRSAIAMFESIFNFAMEVGFIEDYDYNGVRSFFEEATE